MNSLTLRQVSPQENLILIQYVQAYYGYDNLGYNVSVEQAIHELLNDTRLGGAWFIEIDDQIGGYVILTAGFDIEFGGKHGVLTDFYLDEGFRDKGYGYQVLKLIQERAVGYGFRAIELSVTKKNARARHLYERSGFQPLADRDTMLKSIANE
jgi:ribosomal protein S18 acetylase RimI-like enzyme